MPAPRAARACGRCRRGWSPECARSLGELALRTVGGYAPARLSRSPPPTGFIEPCLPTPAAEVPGGPRWVHEIKHDGYRFIGRRESERVRVGVRHARPRVSGLVRAREVLVMLDVRHKPERETGAVRPLELRPRQNRRIGNRLHL